MEKFNTKLLGGIILSKIKNLKLISSGFILGAMFFGGISYAASEAVKLDAYYGVKIIQNGIDKTPAENKPFIVDGSTYVPLRAAADLLGVPINWDGDNSAVTLGKKIEGTPLGAPNSVGAPYKDREGLAKPTIATNQPMVINGKSYGQIGTTLGSEHHKKTGGSWTPTLLKYTLNNQYKKLILGVGFDDSSYDAKAVRNVVFKNQDGKELQSIAVGKGTVKEGIEVDLTGVLQLIIEVDGEGDSGDAKVDFINPILQ